MIQLKARLTSLDNQEKILRNMHKELFQQGSGWEARSIIIEAVHKLVFTRIKLLREYWK